MKAFLPLFLFVFLPFPNLSIEEIDQPNCNEINKLHRKICKGKKVNLTPGDKKLLERFKEYIECNHYELEDECIFKYYICELFSKKRDESNKQETIAKIKYFYDKIKKESEWYDILNPNSFIDNILPGDFIYLLSGVSQKHENEIKGLTTNQEDRENEEEILMNAKDKKLNSKKQSKEDKAINEDEANLSEAYLIEKIFLVKDTIEMPQMLARDRLQKTMVNIVEAQKAGVEKPYTMDRVDVIVHYTNAELHTEYKLSYEGLGGKGLLINPVYYFNNHKREKSNPIHVGKYFAEENLNVFQHWIYLLNVVKEEYVVPINYYFFKSEKELLILNIEFSKHRDYEVDTN